MTETRSTAVQALMEVALRPTDPVALLTFAAKVTKPKTDWKGPRKMSRDQALAATRLVTEMLGRYDLRPTKVLVGGGRASERGATSRFYLSRREMGPDATVDKRLATGVDAHVDNVMAIARHAREAGHDVDEAALLGELAAVLDDFLDGFRDDAGVDPDAELAEDVNRIAVWLSHPARGFELARYLSGARTKHLDFRTLEGAMTFLGPDAADFASGPTPEKPILTRIVAWAEAAVWRRGAEVPSGGEPGGALFASPPGGREFLGRSTCMLCEKVGIGVTVVQGRLRMVFTLSPVAYAGVPIGGPDDPHWATKGSGQELEYHGIPVPDRPEMTSDEEHWIEVKWPDRFVCPDFEALLSETFDDGAGWDEASLVTQRHLPVTAETCATLLSGGEWGNFEVVRSFLGLTWETVLPNWTLNDAGVESRTVRDRFAALLYSEVEPSLAGLLETEARRRCAAYEDFVLKEASGERRRKLGFRARMKA